MGHVTWQGRPAQPNARQQLPITMTVRVDSSTLLTFPNITTDSSGYFTVTAQLSPGTYSWWVKGPKYLASSGTLTTTLSQVTNVEMGQQRAGDCNNDNVVSTTDFNILKGTFGKGVGVPGYDDRADFTGDQVVNTTDFNLLKNNFGQGGSPPLSP